MSTPGWVKQMILGRTALERCFLTSSEKAILDVLWEDPTLYWGIDELAERIGKSRWLTRKTAVHLSARGCLWVIRVGMRVYYVICLDREVAELAEIINGPTGMEYGCCRDCRRELCVDAPSPRAHQIPRNTGGGGGV